MVDGANSWYPPKCGTLRDRHPSVSNTNALEAKKDVTRQKDSSELGDKQATCSKAHQTSEIPTIGAEDCCDTLEEWKVQSLCGFHKLEQSLPHAPLPFTLDIRSGGCHY